jgi:hypothetical protein
MLPPGLKPALLLLQILRQRQCSLAPIAVYQNEDRPRSASGRMIHVSLPEGHHYCVPVQVVFGEGHEKILAWAAEKDPSIRWENSFAHHCQACQRIHTDPRVVEVIRQHYDEVVHEVSALRLKSRAAGSS